MLCSRRPGGRVSTCLRLKILKFLIQDSLLKEWLDAWAREARGITETRSYLVNSR